LDSRAAFLVLIAAQALHSIEEYRYRLFDVFGPARLASGVVSRDLALGFAILNAGIVALGLVTYFVFVRSGGGGARVAAAVWAILEAANGAGHTVLALAAGGYFPGLYTAPLLLGASAYLAYRLRRDPA
jgi:hypothetical protein